MVRVVKVEEEGGGGTKKKGLIGPCGCTGMDFTSPFRCRL